MYGDQFGEFLCGYRGLKGLTAFQNYSSVNRNETSPLSSLSSIFDSNAAHLFKPLSTADAYE